VNDEEEDRSERRRAMSPVLGWDEFRPLSSTVKVQFGACSHPGKIRPVNTDHYLVAELGRHQATLATSLASSDLPARFDEYAFCMLVADGLGASGAGAMASRIAISTFAHLAIHFGQWNIRVDAPTAAEITERAEWFYRRIHETVVKRSRANPALSDMASTLTAVYSAGDELFLVHVGHSRAYLFRDGDLTQLSSDQTTPPQSINTTGPWPVGRLTDDLTHILTDTIGGRTAEPRVHAEHFGLWNGDRILLCTNGLTDAVDDDAIADVLALDRHPDEQCKALVELALRAGGEDNVTAVLAQYTIPKPATGKP
jgi:PPM family protein phosphatase